jgi:hypothetical protein
MLHRMLYGTLPKQHHLRLGLLPRHTAASSSSCTAPPWPAVASRCPGRPQRKRPDLAMEEQETKLSNHHACCLVGLASPPRMCRRPPCHHASTPRGALSPCEVSPRDHPRVSTSAFGVDGGRCHRGKGRRQRRRRRGDGGSLRQVGFVHPRSPARERHGVGSFFLVEYAYSRSGQNFTNFISTISLPFLYY